MKMNIHIWFNKCQLLIYMSVSKKSQNLFNCAWHNLAPNSQLSSYSLHYIAVNFSVKNLQENESIVISTKVFFSIFLLRITCGFFRDDFDYLALIFHILFSLNITFQNSPIIYFWKHTNFLLKFSLNSLSPPYLL